MGKTTAAPHTTPPSLKDADSQTPAQKSAPDDFYYQQNLFYITVLNMSWQLAIVVIVPIVGGFKLDEKFNSSPWLTLLGFVVAAAGTFLVLQRTTRIATEKATGKTKGDSK